MSAAPVQANARCLPLADESVDLVVTSPPYYSLRSYRDGGEHYGGQVGSESTPQAFLEALWEVTKECWRVLKPTGSLFVNLGDKRSGSGGHNNAGLMPPRKMDRPSNTPGGPPRPANPDEPRNVYLASVQSSRRNAPDRYNQAAFGRPKSKMLLPHRFAIGCEDGLADPDGIGWIVRQDIVWSKPNGLPESVTDRVRDSHEMWFHLVKQGRYFSAVDEIRRPSVPQNGLAGTFKRPKSSHDLVPGQAATQQRADRNGDDAYHPLGSLPGSVWTIASEPLTISDAVKAYYDLPDHFAAFPQEWPRRLILGWSPSGVCVACGEGRRPVSERTITGDRGGRKFNVLTPDSDTARLGTEGHRTITGYACACPDASAPTRPSVVCDVFGGTGTVAGVARQLGRTGLSFDLSHDYSRLAQWFLNDGRRFAKTSSRTDRERQGVML